MNLPAGNLQGGDPNSCLCQLLPLSSIPVEREDTGTVTADGGDNFTVAAAIAPGNRRGTMCRSHSAHSRHGGTFQCLYRQ